jgi:hypothetical protein
MSLANWLISKLSHFVFFAFSLQTFPVKTGLTAPGAYQIFAAGGDASRGVSMAGVSTGHIGTCKNLK